MNLVNQLERTMGKLSLPLLQVAILASMIVARPPVALGFAVDDRKCKCFMCVCDFDPHPLPPELPPHHHPAPPTEPEHHSPPPPPPEPEHVLSPPPPPPALPEPEHYYPPPVEHEPAPEYHPYYYPPPAYGYYPSVGLPYYPPAGEMYPRDKESKSGAHRQPRGHPLLLAVLVLASAVLSSPSLFVRSGYW